MQCCITVDTVCALLSTAERYIQYKCTKILIQRVLEFVDDHGNEVLNLGSFALLPLHVVRLILIREELKADEFSKFQAALMWSKKHSDNTGQPVKEIMLPLLGFIQFHMIPANILMSEIYGLNLVPADILMTALAFQADPSSVVFSKSPKHKKRVQVSIRSDGKGSLEKYCSSTTLSSTSSSLCDFMESGLRIPEGDSFRGTSRC